MGGKHPQNRITNINGLDQFERKEMFELCQISQKELRKNLAEGSTDVTELTVTRVMGVNTIL